MRLTMPLSRRAPPLLALLAICGSARAQIVYPAIGTETQIQFQHDMIRLPDGKTTQNLQLNIAHQTIVDFTDQFSVSSLMSMRQLVDPLDGSRSAFANEGLYAEELYAQWTNQIFKVRAGKFAQKFGRAWYLTPGIYGQNFVSDYQLAEQMGVEASWVFLPYQFGQHQISISDFMADRTFLSESLFFNRGRTNISAGGPGNTKDPQSYVLSYDASNVPLPFGALSYQASYAWLGQGLGDTGVEHRASFGVNANIPLNGGVAETLRGRFSQIRLMGEAVRRWDANGVAGQRMDYLTGAMEYVQGNWVFDLSATGRWTTYLGQTTADRLAQATIGYNLPMDTTVALGVAYQRTGGVDGLYVGLQLTYTYTSCDRCMILAKHY